MRRSRSRGRRIAAALAASVVAALALSAGAPAQAVPNQVTGLTVTQNEGFATLAWTPVAGATDYQIERATVSPAGVVGPGTIVGVWQPQRSITPQFPKFAEAGFALGGRYQWRVRARFGTTLQPYSEPVVDTTRPQWGTGPGAGLRTQWETSGNATFTTYDNELLYTGALDAASGRVRMVELGRTNPVASGPAAPGDRAINMLIIGGTPGLTPLPTAQAISDSPAIAFNCNVHGNEPQGRESCFIFARMLAFTEDPHILDILRQTTVLIVPSINGNGRAANTRGNETGADLNRDHAELLQPETKAFAAMLRDYTPEVGIDLHEGDNEDLPILTARHLNVYEPLFNEGKLGLVEGWLYEHSAENGWWHGPYSSGGDSHEGILRNTFALKNSVGLLAENRAAGGATRPAEGTNLANRNRKSYGSLYEEFTMLEYYWARRALIHQTVEESIAFNTSNLGRVVTRGSYPWPYNELTGANTGLPDVDALNPARSIDPAPCGYFLTEPQYSGLVPGGTVGLRLGIHGIAQETRPSGHIVRLAQPLRGLIPTVLDSAAVDPEPIVAGARLFECPFVTVAPRSFATAAVEGTQTVEQLTIGNTAAEVDEPLNWTITEAVSNCSSPSDVSWLSVDQTSGTTASAGGSTAVAVTASAVGLLAPTKLSALLCLRSNDAGESEIALPITFQVQYSFTGFFGPIENPPALNTANAGATVPAKFVIAGGSGLSIVDGGSPTSQQVDCETLEPLGNAAPITTPGSSGFRFVEEESAYQANWKTEKEWAGTCRILSVSLDDDSVHSALFNFS
jgi:hypothetical protein